jgi:hypothetical protein
MMARDCSNTERRPQDRGLVTFAGIRAEILCEFVRHADKSVGIRRCRFLFRDVGPNRRILAVEVEPLFDAGFCVWLDCVDWAFRLAHTTVDALVGVNDEHVLALVEAVHRADLDAIGVFAMNAALVDDVGQLSLLPAGGLSRDRSVLVPACESMRRVTCVAASVQPAHIHDRGVWPLSFDP